MCKGPEVGVSLECSGNSLESGGLECMECEGVSEKQRGIQPHML